MIGFIKRVFLYPIAVVVATLAYVAVALAAAKIAPTVLVLQTTALIALFFTAWWLARLIEGRSGRRATVAAAFAILLTGLVGGGLWRFVGQSKEAETASTAQGGTGERWVFPDGSEIAYQHCGELKSKTARPVLFLHGGPAIPPRQTSIDTVCELGKFGFSVYAYDQIGSGQSSRLEDIGGYTLDRHVSDIEAIRNLLGVETIDIVGVSWGTVLASHYVAQYPAHVGRVVFVSPGVLGPREGVEYDFSLSASSDNDKVMLPPARLVVAGILARINPALANQFMPQDEAAQAMDDFTQGGDLEYQGKCKGKMAGAEQSGSRAMGANYYANLITAQSLAKSADPRLKIAAHAPPTLLMRGECDYIPPASLERYKTAFSKHKVINVEGEGHSFLGARADVVVPNAACWLSERDDDNCLREIILK